MNNLLNYEQIVELDNLIVFRSSRATSPLFFCVHKDDFELYGQDCSYKQGILKGVSDNESEAIQDYLIQVEIVSGIIQDKIIH